MQNLVEMNQNLLKCSWTPEAIEAVLKAQPREPLLPPLGSAAWEQVRENKLARALVQPLRERAITESADPLPVLTDELYASFRKTGHRLQFETVYFERRKRLARAAISLLLGAPNDPERDRFLASMVEKFTSIFEEVSWALPAHVNWHNDDVSGKEPLQIDLFCAETANLMAEMLDLFGAVFPTALQERVRERLRRDVFENYSDRHETFHWTKVSHNWNAVCQQGVLGSALSQCEDTALLARMLFLASQDLPIFLSGFSKDGGCTEGIGYWSYGFGWFTVLNEQLEVRTGGKLSFFEGDEQVRRIAQFGPLMSLAGRKLVNFSDNGAEGNLHPALVAYLGERLDDASCRAQSETGYRALAQTGIALDAQRCDVFHLGRLLLRLPEFLPATTPAAARDCFLPDLGVLVAHGTDARGRVWDFAAKAGHNDEHHNHNDCGSFLLNIDGVRLATEIGPPEYTKDFFSAKRYESIAARSLGHSLPVIAGCEQAAGATYRSKVVRHKLGPEHVEFIVDATACYPAQAECRSFVRTLYFDKSRGRVTVTDAFELDQAREVEGALVSLYPIVVEADRACIKAEELELVIRPGAGTRFDRVEIHPYKSHQGNDAALHRLVLRLEKPDVFAQITMELTLA